MKSHILFRGIDPLFITNLVTCTSFKIKNQLFSLIALALLGLAACQPPESGNEVSSTYDELLGEIAIDDIINLYDLTELSFNSYDEAMESLQTIPEFNSLDKTMQCKFALKYVRRTNCAKDIKYIKQIIRKGKLFSLSVGNDGNVKLTGPDGIVFKNQETRLNLLIIALNVKRAAFCEIKDFCKQFIIGGACDEGFDKSDQIYLDCVGWYKIQFSILDSSLIALNAVIKEYSSGITNEQTKAIAEAKLDREIEELETSVKKDEEEQSEEQNQEQPDSTKNDEPA